MTRRKFFYSLLGCIPAAAVVSQLMASGSKDSIVQTSNYIAVTQGFNVGDVITIDNPPKYAINPITRKSTGMLRRFVVTALTPNGCELKPI